MRPDLGAGASSHILLERDTLWPLTLERTARAARSGALVTLPTTYEVIEDAGAPFVVRARTHGISSTRSSVAAYSIIPTGCQWNFRGSMTFPIGTSPSSSC